ncbi:uncharacterized protein K460DRAFT_38868 [Cucurbitaria berberidis CBS 394.84]|uniref:Uncharacterized protein n=1 Tax=Cucurbitaria berberidis CBS 394.84 TaxID=1168544 RepID=A0A9P4LE99_9PLEO|nr:uncharacterized protein K460DRAFT_38868 [Cucurbitaria berberidis CBS 394.84]KAF1851648.1 hypothetical protein K460DRAFT_38868 [Cucurbitaria berberidis CBS 394.84]
MTTIDSIINIKAPSTRSLLSTHLQPHSSWQNTNRHQLYNTNDTETETEMASTPTIKCALAGHGCKSHATKSSITTLCPLCSKLHPLILDDFLAQARADSAWPEYAESSIEDIFHEAMEANDAPHVCVSRHEWHLGEEWVKTLIDARKLSIKKENEKIRGPPRYDEDDIVCQDVGEPDMLCGLCLPVLKSCDILAYEAHFEDGKLKESGEPEDRETDGKIGDWAVEEREMAEEELEEGEIRE